VNITSIAIEIHHNEFTGQKEFFKTFKNKITDMAIFRRKGVDRYKQCCGSALVSADPDPDFYLNMDPDPVPDPGGQTNADSC
jgi:hypothetical protein